MPPNATPPSAGLGYGRVGLVLLPLSFTRGMGIKRCHAPTNLHPRVQTRQGAEQAVRLRAKRCHTLGLLASWVLTFTINVKVFAHLAWVAFGRILSITTFR